jgi:uracil-DNA glycosylase family 4
MSYDARAHGCQCDRCPLKGEQVVPPEGNPDARIAIINEAPGLSELKHGKQWIGPAGAKLNELLFKAGLHRNQLWMTSALLCRPEVPDKEGRRRFDLKEYMAWMRRENVKIRRQNKALKKVSTVSMPEIASPLDCCAPRLRGELSELDRKARAAGTPNGLVVVPLGSFALGLLTTKPGTMQSILKYRGSVIFPKEQA